MRLASKYRFMRWMLPSADFLLWTLAGLATPAHAQTSSTTSIVATQNPSRVGDPVDFAVTVSGADGGLTGMLTLKFGDGTSSSAELSDGKASIQHTYVSAGIFLVTATYDGDGTRLTSVGAAAQSVTKAATTTTLGSQANPGRVGKAVVFAATVSAAAGTPTGKVTFKFGDGASDTGSLFGGTATVSHTYASANNFTVTATYHGDRNYFTGLNTMEQNVEQVAAPTVGSRPDRTKEGQSAFSPKLAPGPGDAW